MILSSLTLRAFSRYILYLSSMALMSSSFFFRAAISSSTFKASRQERNDEVSLQSYCAVVDWCSIAVVGSCCQNKNVIGDLQVWVLSGWRSSSSSFFFMISSWASFSWTLWGKNAVFTSLYWRTQTFTLHLSTLIQELTLNSHLHVRIKLPFQVWLKKN